TYVGIVVTIDESRHVSLGRKLEQELLGANRARGVHREAESNGTSPEWKDVGIQVPPIRTLPVALLPDDALKLFQVRLLPFLVDPTTQHRSDAIRFRGSDSRLCRDAIEAAANSRIRRV